MMKKCGVVLSKLMKHKNGWIFNVPVDVVGMGLHDYNQIIKHPMDLGTVKSKLGNNLYQSPSDFASDVRLTFNNALRYNPKGHDVNAAAEQLLARFGELFEPEHRRYESERQVAAAAEMEPRRSSWNHQSPPPSIVPKSSAAARASTERTAPAPAPAPAPDPDPAPAPVAPVAPPSAAAKQLGVRSGKPPPKPKAKDPNKREMTFEEKQKLSLNLQSLPQEKMDQVLQIISKRDSKLAQHGDEIEVDIECIDKETLWELDRFVGYYRKMVSKMKRQALTAAGQNSIATEESKFTTTVDETPEEEGTTGDAAAKKSKKGEAGGVEEEVDIGEEMPASNFPPVEIEKDAAGQASRSSSSSSSSSDDDDNSSSSDSDSGSSSASDSDDDEDEAQSPKKTSPGGG
ncbi:hypothetical protein Syun_013528 [Stephania yunnanensis]|uniref:Uncharacterized protein n=1 Tax=Stephania yunnanensis TaxID=152371 RepID=A0AAP0P7V0_9MAGN